MQKKTVSDILQVVEGLRILCDYRTAFYISACHDEQIRAPVCPVQEQEVKRCVGKHDAEPGAEA